jgi:hypothetical protein
MSNIESSAAPERFRTPSLLVLLALASLILLTAHREIIDDAFIVFRCAANLRTHGTMDFNPGERVECCTDFLWVLLVAAGSLLPKVDEPVVALVLSYGLLLFTLIRLWQFALLMKSSPWHGAVAGLCLMLNPHFLQANTNGLESALFGALLVEMVYRWRTDQFNWACFLGGLLFWTRPEGAVVALTMCAAAYYERRKFRELVPGLAILSSLVLVLTLFRLFYFGALIPNSVVAKSFPLSLIWDYRQLTLDYLALFARQNPQFIAILGIAAFTLMRLVWSRGDRSDIAIFLFCLATILFSVAVVVRNCGDWMPHSRLFMHYGVVYGLLFVLLCRRSRKLNLIMGVALLISCGQFALEITRRPGPLVGAIVAHKDPYHDEVYQRLKDHLKSTDVIAAEKLGWIGYQLPSQTFHDPFGLADAHIARNGRPAIQLGKTDLQYTFKTVKPAVLIWIAWSRYHQKGLTPKVRIKGQAERELFQTRAAQELTQDYVAFNYPAKGDHQENCVVFIRRDRLADLGQAFKDWPTK